MIKVQFCNDVQVRFLSGFYKKPERNKIIFTTMTSSDKIPGTQKYLRFTLFTLFTLFTIHGFSQDPEAVYKSSIQSVRFHMYGDQQSLPIYNINSGDQLELNFDDMEANVKSYYYSFQLCDYNWAPVDISPFLY